jgi:hypothetical protein
VKEMNEFKRTDVSRKKKVVFKDDTRYKTAVGTVSFEFGFVKVTNELGSTILINKSFIVSIRDLEW